MSCQNHRVDEARCVEQPARVVLEQPAMLARDVPIHVSIDPRKTAKLGERKKH